MIVTNNNLAPLRAMAESILRRPDAFHWTIQGFGMLRLHMPGNVRLHVWDSRYRVPNVSDIHDHLQWGLASTIVAGELRNVILEEGPRRRDMQPYNCVVLKPGEGTTMKSPIRSVGSLRMVSSERYTAGMTYRQEPAEIHCSIPTDGTVTVMTKFPTGDESARVYWPAGTDWVSAEPREATMAEIVDITQNALRTWFGGSA
jgi:hypothetical protein